MATYIGIKGAEIQTIAGDPANPLEGQVWYNTTANTLKGYGKQGTGAWAASEDIPTTGLEYCGLAGIQTAAVLWGGIATPPYSPPPMTQDTTFEFDGTSWTEVNPTVGRYANNGGVGTQTAAAGFGQQYGADTIEYDGTSWTNGVNRPFVAAASINFGTQTAGVSSAGYNPGATPSGNLDTTAHYDGTSWTAGTAYPAQTSAGMGAGTQTAGLGFGGYAPGIVTTTNLYDGTTWTSTGALNEARFSGTGGGSQTAAITGGGGSPAGVTVNTEIFNGSTWTEVGNLGTKAGYQAKGFSMVAAATLGFISIGGTNSPPGFVATGELWNVPDAIKTFTSS